MKTKLAIASLCLILASCGDTGGGDKVGSITKLAQEGVMCKTWEGQIIRGGFSNGSGAQGQAFDFTIENNPELVKKVQQLMESQTEVKITYRSEFASFCRSETHGNVFLTGIEPLKPEADRPLKVDTKTPIPVAVAASAPASSAKQTREQRIIQLQNELIRELQQNQK